MSVPNGRPGKRISPEQEASIVHGVAEGTQTQKQLAKDAAVSVKTVQRVTERHEDRIRELQQDLKRRTLERMSEEFDEMFDARLRSICNPDSRTAAQDLRVLGEMAGVIGKSPLVAIDQRSVTISVDAAKLQVLASLPHGAAKRRLEDRLAALAGDAPTEA